LIFLSVSFSPSLGLSVLLFYVLPSVSFFAGPATRVLFLLVFFSFSSALLLSFVLVFPLRCLFFSLVVPSQFALARSKIVQCPPPLAGRGGVPHGKLCFERHDNLSVSPAEQRKEEIETGGRDWNASLA
jgi:hypothetical protein